MEEHLSDDDSRPRERYVLPEELGLDPAHHDKFSVSGSDPFYVIRKDGRRVRLYTDEHGDVREEDAPEQVA